jgi:protocadherin Fat 1/2/3
MMFAVHASDRDEGSNGEVRYSLGGPGDVFAVDPYSGWLTTLVPLDRETVPSYTITVIATDNGSPQQTASTEVYIRLIDYNDNPPIFAEESYSATGMSKTNVDYNIHVIISTNIN